MCKVRVDVHDSQTGFIVFQDLSTKEAHDLKGVYGTEDVLTGKNQELEKLLKKCVGVKAVSYVLQHLDQRNMTIEVSMADDTPS